MKRIDLFKLATCCFVGAGLLLGCQKENTPPVDNGSASVKYAQEVTINDQRDWGTPANWLGPLGSLSFLGQLQLPTKAPDLFYGESNEIIVPNGIKVTEESFVYVTYVGQSASFNNVLGYYYYNENSGVDEEGVLNQIFISTPEKFAFKNVIYNKTRDLEFGYTFELSDKDGNKFPAGTIIGFCLLPNSGGDAVFNNGDKTTELPMIQMRNNKPIYIATNWGLNEAEKISHVVGKSACGDLVIAFEDRNSTYSDYSDEDFNDLVFVVGDNLITRNTTRLEAYSSNSKPFELPDMGVNCLRCVDADEELVSLTNNLGKIHQSYTGNNPLESQIEEVYGPVFLKQEVNNAFLPLSKATQLYARLAYSNCGNYNTVGWFAFPETGEVTFPAINNQITVDGKLIKEDHIIFRNVHGLNGFSNSFIELTKAFAAGERVGFFIVSNENGPVGTGLVEYNNSGATKNGFLPIRFTNVRNDNGKNQAQIIVQSQCNNVIIAFEDIKEEGKVGDNDFNDVIFNISDNNQTLASSSFVLEKIYLLSQLNYDYCRVFGGCE